MLRSLSLQLSGLELSHAEEVLEKVGEAEAHLMGQMAGLRLQHKEEIQQLQQLHQDQVRGASKCGVGCVV